MTTDADVQAQIDRLEEERDMLRAREGEGDPTQGADADRIEEVRVELDRLFDLKRQRQAKRDAGTVEGYEQ